MVEKGIKGGMCHAIHKYVTANSKYMKNCNTNKKSLYILHLDANNLNGWVMSQKLPVHGFEWNKNVLKFNEDFIKSYNEDSTKGYNLEVDVEYPNILHICIVIYYALPERMKIDKCNKLVCNLYDKKNYVVHMRSLKQALDHGIILKKVHKIIQFNQEARLKEYIGMNTKLRKEAKNDVEKDFFKFMNNSVF